MRRSNSSRKSFRVLTSSYTEGNHWRCHQKMLAAGGSPAPPRPAFLAAQSNMPAPEGLSLFSPSLFRGDSLADGDAPLGHRHSLSSSQRRRGAVTSNPLRFQSFEPVYVCLASGEGLMVICSASSFPSNPTGRVMLLVQ